MLLNEVNRDEKFSIEKITPNEKQNECINKINGTVMVLAGPGTGKTFVVIERITKMLKTGIKPEEILCLTYSEAASNEMKTRLIKKAGIKGTTVQINTYHSFCNEIIHKYPSKFELYDNVKLIDDISKINIAKEVMDEIKPKSLRNKWGDYYYYIKSFLSSVDEIKKNRIRKEKYYYNIKNASSWEIKLKTLKTQLEDRINSGKTKNKTVEKEIENQKKKIDKAYEIWDLYELYNKKLALKNFIDFNDMINFVVDEFENDVSFLEEVAKKYNYILVDEYQDTNVLQNKLLHLLAKGAKSNNIFVVGDDDQIIYGFQGAKNDNIENFLKTYPETHVICLDQNNRSTQNILDLSYKIISQDKNRLENKKEYKKYNIAKKLTAKNENICKKSKKVKFEIYNEKIEETNKIVEKVIELSKMMPENLKEIAILGRENTDLKEFATQLEAKGVPYQMKTTKSIFEIKSSIITYFYLKILNNQILSTDKLTGILQSEPFNICDEDFCFILNQNYPKQKNIISLIQENINNNWKEPKRVINFIKTYEDLLKLKSHKSTKGLIWHLVNKTGILDYYVNCEIDKFENILAINRIMDEAEIFEDLNPGSNLNDFIKHMDFAFSENIPLEIEKNNQIQNAIQLITIHGSKGREFEYVFMPNLVSTKWEDKSIKNILMLPIDEEFSEEDMETKRFSENLKLLFVGVTRAKHYLNLSYGRMDKNKEKTLTSYLNEIMSEKNEIEIKIHSNEEYKYDREIAKRLSIKNYNHYRAYKKEIESRIENIRINPHTLSQYQNCPREFLYSSIYKLKNFDKDTNIMDYGNAIHNTIDKTINKAKENGCYATKDEVKKIYREYIDKIKFKSEKDYQMYLERGDNAIERYYHHLIETNINNIVKMEYDLGEIETENIKITGRIDRIEKMNDGTFCLYDYKTGKAKSKTKVRDEEQYENYLNQLRFYKFAFEQKYKGYKVSKTGLIFIEEPEKNLYFKFTYEDNEKIKNKIIETHKKIKDLEFDPIETKEQNKNEKCTYCDYKMLCRIDTK